MTPISSTKIVWSGNIKNIWKQHPQPKLSDQGAAARDQPVLHWEYEQVGQWEVLHLYTLYFILYFILYKWVVSLLSPFASILWLFRHLARMTNTFFWVFRLWIWEFEIYYLKKIFVFADGKNVSGTSVRRAILLANRFTTSIWKFGVRDTNPSTCNTALRSKDFGRLRQQYHKEG